MKYLARNKKTGLPAGIFDEATKNKMEVAPEYASILSFEPVNEPKPAPRPQAVKPAATKSVTRKKATRAKKADLDK